jgi:hypothetical protein
LLIKLLYDLLAEVIFSTLMVLLFLLFLLILLLDIHSHVRLILILFYFVENNTTLNILEGLTSLLFKSNDVVTNKINEVETLINNLVFLFKKHLYVG